MAVAVVLMGVSGSGKTAVGRALAAARGWEFVDADDLHAPEARAAMSAGRAMTDAERRPWLARLAAELSARAGRDVVLACSALTREARAMLRGARADVRLVHLRASPAVLAQRLAGRSGHFFPPALLASQLDALEGPDGFEDVLTVDADPPLEAVVASVSALVP